MYIGGGEALLYDREKKTVMVYDPQCDSYDTLPPYAYKWFAMTALKKQLVLIGGLDVKSRKKTNQLGVWNGEWTHPLPPLTVACTLPSVITHKDRWIVVMGGGGDSNILSRVEILDTSESSHWCNAAPLPRPCYHVLPAVIGNTCYLLGGYHEKGYVSKKASSVCMESLIAQATHQSSDTSATASLWQALPNTPVEYATPLVFGGAVLTVGGNYSQDIHRYQPSSSSWIKVGELPTTRVDCCCAVLPGSGELFVCGGFGTDTRVDIASIL